MTVATLRNRAAGRRTGRCWRPRSCATRTNTATTPGNVITRSDERRSSQASCNPDMSAAPGLDVDQFDKHVGHGHGEPNKQRTGRHRVPRSDPGLVGKLCRHDGDDAVENGSYAIGEFPPGLGPVRCHVFRHRRPQKSAINIACRFRMAATSTMADRDQIAKVDRSQFNRLTEIFRLPQNLDRTNFRSAYRFPSTHGVSPLRRSPGSIVAPRRARFGVECAIWWVAAPS